MKLPGFGRGSGEKPASAPPSEKNRPPSKDPFSGLIEEQRRRAVEQARLAGARTPDDPGTPQNERGEAVLDKLADGAKRWGRGPSEEFELTRADGTPVGTGRAAKDEFVPKEPTPFADHAGGNGGTLSAETLQAQMTQAAMNEAVARIQGGDDAVAATQGFDEHQIAEVMNRVREEPVAHDPDAATAQAVGERGSSATTDPSVLAAENPGDLAIRNAVDSVLAGGDLNELTAHMSGEDYTRVFQEVRAADAARRPLPEGPVDDHPFAGSGWGLPQAPAAAPEAAGSHLGPQGAVTESDASAAFRAWRPPLGTEPVIAGLGLVQPRPSKIVVDQATGRIIGQLNGGEEQVIAPGTVKAPVPESALPADMGAKPASPKPPEAAPPASPPPPEGPPAPPAPDAPEPQQSRYYLTQEARDLLARGRAFGNEVTTRNLRKIARQNEVEVTDGMTVSEIFDALEAKARGTAAPMPSVVATTPPLRPPSDTPVYRPEGVVPPAPSVLETRPQGLGDGPNEPPVPPVTIPISLGGGGGPLRGETDDPRFYDGAAGPTPDNTDYAVSDVGLSTGTSSAKSAPEPLPPGDGGQPAEQGDYFPLERLQELTNRLKGGEDPATLFSGVPSTAVRYAFGEAGMQVPNREMLDSWGVKTEIPPAMESFGRSGGVTFESVEATAPGIMGKVRPRRTASQAGASTPGEPGAPAAAGGAGGGEAPGAIPTGLPASESTARMAARAGVDVAGMSEDDARRSIDAKLGGGGRVAARPATRGAEAGASPADGTSRTAAESLDSEVIVLAQADRDFLNRAVQAINSNTRLSVEDADRYGEIMKGLTSGRMRFPEESEDTGGENPTSPGSRQANLESAQMNYNMGFASNPEAIERQVDRYGRMTDRGMQREVARLNRVISTRNRKLNSAFISDSDAQIAEMDVEAAEEMKSELERIMQEKDVPVEGTPGSTNNPRITGGERAKATVDDSIREAGRVASLDLNALKGEVNSIKGQIEFVNAQLNGQNLDADTRRAYQAKLRDLTALDRQAGTLLSAKIREQDEGDKKTKAKEAEAEEADLKKLRKNTLSAKDAKKEVKRNKIKAHDAKKKIRELDRAIDDATDESEKERLRGERAEAVRREKRAIEDRELARKALKNAQERDRTESGPRDDFTIDRVRRMSIGDFLALKSREEQGKYINEVAETVPVIDANVARNIYNQLLEGTAIPTIEQRAIVAKYVADNYLEHGVRGVFFNRGEAAVNMREIARIAARHSDVGEAITQRIFNSDKVMDKLKKRYPGNWEKVKGVASGKFGLLSILMLIFGGAAAAATAGYSSATGRR